MALILKQSTAVDVLIGPFVDSTDGYTAETGVSPSVKLSKNGQTLAAKNDVTTPVHDADGYYNCELDATDTNTVGTLVLTVVGSATSLPVRHEFYVVEEAVYDAMYGASAAGPLQSTTAGRTLDVAATGEAGVDLGNVTGTLTQANVGWVDANSRVDVGSWLGNAVTYSAAAGPDVNVQAIDDIDAPATWKASINTEVDNSMVTYGLDHLVSASVADTDVADNSIIAKLTDSTAVTADFTNYDWTTDSLRAVRDHIGDGTNLTEAGGTGDHLTAVADKTTLDAIETDTQDIQSRLPAALVSGRMSSDMVSISGEMGPADNLAESAKGIISGATSGTPTTTTTDTDLTGYLDDELIGRTIIFVSGTANGQASDITDYASTNGVVTMTALATAPASGDTFVIV